MSGEHQRIRRQWQPRSLALGLGTLLGALMLEGGLRFFPGSVVAPSLENEQSWRARHAGTGLALDAASEVFSPELGWEPWPNVRTPGLTSNSRGLRGDREYAFEPSCGVYRVICVGDSFVFGEGLTDVQTMPAQLERKLNDADRPRWEVLNLAVRGYGTDQQLLRLEHLGFLYQPDVVVLGFFEEDVWRNALSFRDYAKPYFELADGALAHLDMPSLYLPSFARWLPARLIGPGFLLLDLSGTRMGRVTLAILDAMRDAVVRHDARFILLIIPRQALPWRTGIDRMLRRWAQQTGTPMLDLHDAYLRVGAAERKRLYKTHWTAKGARLTAELLAAQLRALAVAGLPRHCS